MGTRIFKVLNQLGTLGSGNLWPAFPVLLGNLRQSFLKNERPYLAFQPNEGEGFHTKMKALWDEQ